MREGYFEVGTVEDDRVKTSITPHESRRGYLHLDFIQVFTKLGHGLQALDVRVDVAGALHRHDAGKHTADRGRVQAVGERP